MEDFSINEMLEMQKSLQEKYETLVNSSLIYRRPHHPAVVNHPCFYCH